MQESLIDVAEEVEEEVEMDMSGGLIEPTGPCTECGKWIKARSEICSDCS